MPACQQVFSPRRSALAERSRFWFKDGMKTCMHSFIGRARRMAAVAVASAWFGAAALSPAHAELPAVLEATVEAQPNSLYAFQATIAHTDEGFAHYANEIQVVNPSTGAVLATRPIFAPNKTGSKVSVKSLSNVEIPIGVTDVLIRAVCSRDGVGTRTVRLTLPPRK
jgi:hypothetical protein